MMKAGYINTFFIQDSKKKNQTFATKEILKTVDSKRLIPWKHQKTNISLNPSRYVQVNRELEQGQRRRQRGRHKFAYLVGKNNRFARPARAFFIFVHFFAVFSKRTT